jgi:hypothetical protein
VLRLVRSGLDYEAVGRRLGIPAGQAYLIATGLPADGGDTLPPQEERRPGMLPTSSQHLANPAPENPTVSHRILDWLKQRAAADHSMGAAARERDAGPGDVPDPEGVWDVTDLLTRDHDRITMLLKQLKALPGPSKGGSPVHASRRESLVDMISVALAQHEPAEQQHLWPAVRRALPDGDELAETALRQEAEGTRLLAELGRTSPHTETFDELAEQLAQALRKHVAFEDMVFARLREAVPQEERDALGRGVRQAEKAAPTRPHPHAPEKPAPAVKAAGAAAAPLDLMRDRTTGRPADRRGQAEDESRRDDDEGRS